MAQVTVTSRNTIGNARRGLATTMKKLASTSNNQNATRADFDNVIESTAEETNVSVSTSDTHCLDATSDRTVREQCFHIECIF